MLRVISKGEIDAARNCIGGGQNLIVLCAGDVGFLLLLFWFGLLLLLLLFCVRCERILSLMIVDAASDLQDCYLVGALSPVNHRGLHQSWISKMRRKCV